MEYYRSTEKVAGNAWRPQARAQKHAEPSWRPIPPGPRRWDSRGDSKRRPPLFVWPRGSGGEGRVREGRSRRSESCFFLCENAFTIRRSGNLPNIANVGAITGSQVVDEEERTLWPASVHVLLKSNESYDILSQILRE